MWLSQLSQLPSCCLGCICSGLFCHWCHFTIRCSGMAWPVVVVADGSSPGGVSTNFIHRSHFWYFCWPIKTWQIDHDWPMTCCKARKLFDGLHAQRGRWFPLEYAALFEITRALCHLRTFFEILYNASEMECIWFILIVVACSCDILSLAASQVNKILDVLVTEGNTFDVKSDTSVDEIIQYFNKRGVYYEAACRMVFIYVYMIYGVYCSTVHFRIRFPFQRMRIRAHGLGSHHK